jgi:orotate phosphoribosyltransferase
MSVENKALSAFEATGGILKGHFLLTSGRHSDTYMQCAKLFVDPVHSEALVAELVKKLDGEKIDVVAAPAVGGIILGYALARQLGCLNVFSERVDGKMELRRGFSIKPSDRVLVVEDVVTTGGSVKEVIELVRLAGASVIGVASLVDRSGGAVDFGVRFFNLISMNIESYEAAECPLCKKGTPAIKPGSRNLK